MASGSIRLPCTFCGEEVRRSPSTLANANGRAYCNQQCYRADRPNRPPRKVRKGYRKSPYVSVPCFFCGVTVERRQSDVHGRVFCSRACNGAQSKVEGRPGRPGKSVIGTVREASQGYREIMVGKDHPMANSGGWCLEHRLVMADHIGRPLTRLENIHHRNGVRSDNRISNLELWSLSQPTGQRASDLLAWAHEIVATYGPVADRI